MVNVVSYGWPVPRQIPIARRLDDSEQVRCSVGERTTAISDSLAAACQPSLQAARPTDFSEGPHRELYDEPADMNQQPLAGILPSVWRHTSQRTSLVREGRRPLSRRLSLLPLLARQALPALLAAGRLVRLGNSLPRLPLRLPNIQCRSRRLGQRLVALSARRQDGPYHRPFRGVLHRLPSPRHRLRIRSSDRWHGRSQQDAAFQILGVLGLEGSAKSSVLSPPQFFWEAILGLPVRVASLLLLTLAIDPLRVARALDPFTSQFGQSPDFVSPSDRRRFWANCEGMWLLGSPSLCQRHELGGHFNGRPVHTGRWRRCRADIPAWSAEHAATLAGTVSLLPCHDSLYPLPSTALLGESGLDPSIRVRIFRLIPNSVRPYRQHQPMSRGLQTTHRGCTDVAKSGRPRHRTTALRGWLS